MADSAVELKVGGQTYRVVSRSTDEELQRLAGIVDDRLRELVQPGRQIPTQALLLVAMALAHDAEEERAKRVRLERQSKDLMLKMVHRMDEAIAACDAAHERASREKAAPNSPEA